MTNWPILSLITFLPLMGILFILSIRREDITGDNRDTVNNTNNVALLTTISTLILSLSLIVRFDFNSVSYQLTEKVIISEFGGKQDFSLGIDAIGLIFVVISSFLAVICILASRDKIKTKQKEYIISLLLGISFMNGMFCSVNMVLFGVFFFLFPFPFLFASRINSLADDIKDYKWLLFNFLASSVLFLLAAVTVYVSKDLNENLLLNKIVWFLMFFTLFFRIGLMPNHFWVASFLRKIGFPMASFFLVGSLFSAVYVMLRFMLPLVSDTAILCSFFVKVLALAIIFYCSLSIVLEKNNFRFLSYLYGVFLGILFLGIYSFDEIMLSATVFIIVASSIPLMILQFEFNKKTDGEKRIVDVLKIFLLPAIIVFPPFAIFSGFILLITRLFNFDILSMAVVIFSAFFASISILVKYKNIMDSKLSSKRENMILLSLLSTVILMAFYQTQIYSVLLDFSNNLFNTYLDKAI